MRHWVHVRDAKSFSSSHTNGPSADVVVCGLSWRRSSRGARTILDATIRTFVPAPFVRLKKLTVPVQRSHDSVVDRRAREYAESDRVANYQWTICRSRSSGDWKCCCRRASAVSIKKVQGIVARINNQVRASATEAHGILCGP